MFGPFLPDAQCYLFFSVFPCKFASYGCPDENKSEIGQRVVHDIALDRFEGHTRQGFFHPYEFSPGMLCIHPQKGYMYR